MRNKKVFLTVLSISFIVFITACNSNNDNSNKSSTIIIGETTGTNEPATQFSHIHGLSKHPLDNEKLLLASHHGLIEFDKTTKTASYVGSERFDLMGFTRIPNSEILITSGHPAENSELPDPLGFLWSSDFGSTWEVRSLHGMVDFHSLTSTSDQSRLLGYGSDYKTNVIFGSKDKGFTWNVIKTKGLPLSHDEFFSIAIVPDNANIAYAATSKGLFVSNDGGTEWNKRYDGFITALTVLEEDQIIFYEASSEGLLRLSDNVLMNLNLYLGRDAVNYIVTNDTNGEILISTFNNNLMETTNHGEQWDLLVKEGKF